jgi:hypothetical protein
VNVLNMLNWWQWVILAGVVPPAIIALYFLKLKRRPVEVPSTYLWLRSIEDLHVNTIWQRLRRNLLLFLQLLLILLAILAVLRPGWRGTQLTGDRFIFLIDNSASMQATDVQPSRLEDAKRQARELVDQMKSGDVAMVVSFADTAQVEQMFTYSRRQLRQAIDKIQPTDRSTSLLEALKVASGLANPSRSGSDPGDVLTAEAMPATVLIFSDGKFPNVQGFSLGNLNPIYKPIGDPEAANVGITAFSVRRNESRPEQLQAFARLENFSAKPISISLELRIGDRLLDADRFQLDAEEARGVSFDVGAVDQGVLQLTARTGDALSIDDVAWTVLDAPRQARVLLVTPGVEPLELALGTSAARELADVKVESPTFLTTEVYRQQAATGQYDLMIYDRCRPEQMPQANTLWIGALPPAGGWNAGPRTTRPGIIDTDPAHPLMQWLNLDQVVIAEGTPLEVPASGSVLIDSNVGPLFAIAPRGSFEDAVLGFVFIGQHADQGKNVETFVGTSWPIRPSFPGFVLNILQYLGGGRTAVAGENVRPGQPMVFDNPGRDTALEMRTPAGQSVRLEQRGQEKVNFTETGRLGVYELRAGGKPIRDFAVNLFQGMESGIRPAPEIQIGHVDVAGKANWEVARREIWKELLLAGLVVLCVEWYTYNRRVAW